MAITTEAEVCIRPGALRELAPVLNSLNSDKVFVVADRGAYEFSGAREVVTRDLAAFELTLFQDFEPNPKIEDAEAAIERFIASGAQAIVAIGGGTAIDLAKLVAAFAGAPDDARAMILKHASITQLAAPLVVAPTTAGTGSEATHFAVVYIDGVKYSVAGAGLLPGHVLIDPLLTHSLPPAVTAATGLDAFCQAIESMWAVGATEESLGYAEASARLSLRSLPAAVNSPTPETREQMCRAAYLAGKAINITKTTLPHAMSYAITSEFGVPHGQAVALTLAAVLEFNAGVTDSDCTDPRGAAAVRERIKRICEVLGARDVSQASAVISSLIAATGSPQNCRQAGIDPTVYEAIAAQVNPQRLRNNPRATTPADLMKLLASG